MLVIKKIFVFYIVRKSIFLYKVATNRRGAMKFFSTAILLLLLLYSASLAITQSEVDSLWSSYNALKDDTAKVNKIYQAALEMYEDYPTQTVKFSEAGIEISEKINYRIGKANCLRVKGIALSNIGDFNRGLDYFYQSLAIYKQISDLPGIAKVYANIAIIFFIEGNFDKSLEYNQLAYRVHDSIGGEGSSVGKARCLANLGNIYRAQDKPDEALGSYYKALRLLDSSASLKSQSILYDNIAAIYFAKGDYDKAFSAESLAIEASRKEKSMSGLAYTYTRLAEFNLSLAQNEKNQSKKAAYLSKCFEQAFKALEFADNVGQHLTYSTIYHALYLAYKEKGDYANALKYSEIYNHTKDSLFTIEKSKAVADLDAKYEIQLKQSQIEVLESQKAKDLFKFAFLVSLLLLIIITVIIISFKLKRKNQLSESLIKKLTEAVEQSANHIMITNIDGKIEYINKRFTEVTGYTKEETIGQSPNILKSGTYSKSEYKELWTTVLSGKTWNSELINKKKSGELYWEKNIITPIFNEKGEITNFISIKEDITESKKAQEKIESTNKMLNDILNAASEIAIISTDIDGKINIFNKGAEFITGYQAQEVIGRAALLEFYLDSELKQRASEVRNEMKMGISDFDALVIKANTDGSELREWTYVCKDKSYRAVSVVLYPIISVDGDRTGYLFVAQDITKRKIAEQQLKELNESLELKVEDRTKELNNALKIIEQANEELTTLNESIAREAKKLLELNEKLGISENELKIANQTKDKFISIIAHDLRNPIGGIKSLLEILNNYFGSYSKEDLEKRLKTALYASTKTYDLLEHLLTWAQTTMGNMEFNPQVSSIYDVVEKTIDVTKPAAEQKSISIMNSIQKNHFAYFDEKCIGTVLRNLITNSIKYSHKNSVIKIDIKADYIDSEHSENYVMISIADSGIGMSEKEMDKLFKLDKVQSMPGTENEAGTGLGLILCKEFVEKHTGKIWCDSKEGVGTTFFFTLPKKAIS